MSVCLYLVRFSRLHNRTCKLLKILILQLATYRQRLDAQHRLVNKFTRGAGTWLRQGFVTEAFSLSASTMFLDAEYKNDPALEGKTPAVDVPEFTASIWSTYAFEQRGTDVNLGVYPRR